MARQLRLEYEGTLYHIISRNNVQAAIYRDDEERTEFLVVLEAVLKFLR
jgi:putative transposase